MNTDCLELSFYRSEYTKKTKITKLKLGQNRLLGLALGWFDLTIATALGIIKFYCNHLKLQHETNPK